MTGTTSGSSGLRDGRVVGAGADIDFGETGFFACTDLAGRYRVPRHLTLERLPRIHVRIQWRDAEGAPHRMRGPICIGGGRFYGLGLFATS
jgi:CRISPR-associated protein Csb2